MSLRERWFMVTCDETNPEVSLGSQMNRRTLYLHQREVVGLLASAVAVLSLSAIRSSSSLSVAFPQAVSSNRFGSKLDIISS